MKILQLCCVTNLWGSDHTVVSIDIKNGIDVLDLPDNFGRYFDLVVAAPPCDQFTKANSQNWQAYPDHFIYIATKCFNICRSTSQFWFLENPPGRIEKLIPALTPFRALTWSGNITNKEYIVYSNFLIVKPRVKRYGKQHIPWTKSAREAWQPDFIETIKGSLPIGLSYACRSQYPVTKNNV